MTFVIGHLAYISYRHFTLFQMGYTFYHRFVSNKFIDKSGHISSNSVAFVTGLQTVTLL